MKSLSIYILLILMTTVNMDAQNINPVLKKNIKAVEKQFDEINEARKKELTMLADKIKQQINEQGSSKVTFVCTHNSRRSQLAELWLRAASEYYGLENIASYSGGTEATAFNPRMVDAVLRFGFYLRRSKDATNPRYLASIDSKHTNDHTMFSKKYDDEFNPGKDFIAVMVCSQADAECPFVPGAYSRISLPYEDPKAFDDTDQEATAYDQKVEEIGRELLFVGKILSES